MKHLTLALVFLVNITLSLAAKKNLIIDTDLFSDVDDAGALLLAATSPDVNLLAVNINYPSSYSALAASAILAHYGKGNVPIGIRRPLNNNTFFDGLHFELGEYTSKVAYHFSSGSLPWGRAEDAWDPVALYRKVLAEAEDGSVTIVSIGFLDNLSALLNSTADAYSPLPGRALLARKVAELVVMGGGYPAGRSWNFWGSNASLAAHVINTWDSGGGGGAGPPITFLGGDVGKHVLAGGPLMAQGPVTDPVRMAYVWYGYYTPRPSWDPLAVVYAIHGLEAHGGLFEVGGGVGYNWVEADGSNRWVWDEAVTGQRFLRLKARNESAAEVVDGLLLRGALSVVKGGDADQGRVSSSSSSPCKECVHEEL